jgi:hypothetical protein
MVYTRPACSLRLSLLLLFCLRPFALVSRSAVLITSLSLSTAVCMDLSPPCYRALFPPIWLWISALDWTGTASIQEWLIGLGQHPTDPLSHLHAVEGMSIYSPPCLFPSLTHCSRIYVPHSNDGPRWSSWPFFYAPLTAVFSCYFNDLG